MLVAEPVAGVGRLYSGMRRRNKDSEARSIHVARKILGSRSRMRDAHRDDCLQRVSVPRSVHGGADGSSHCFADGSADGSAYPCTDVCPCRLRRGELVRILELLVDLWRRAQVSE
jgi:hypothetical protein